MSTESKKVREILLKKVKDYREKIKREKELQEKSKSKGGEQ